MRSEEAAAVTPTQGDFRFFRPTKQPQAGGASLGQSTVIRPDLADLISIFALFRKDTEVGEIIPGPCPSPIEAKTNPKRKRGREVLYRFKPLSSKE
jgi:hypothetical protein